MNEKPILFSGPMVRAILEGRKTQTRRAIKPQPKMVIDGIPHKYIVRWPGVETEIKCPHGQLGDRLWVRESCYVCGASCKGEPLMEQPVVYAADGAKKSAQYPHVRPSIFMPRWASRITLEITGSPYVFVSTQPGPNYGQRFKVRRKFLKGLCKKAGVKPFGFHALRRYVASILADSHKVSAKTIQRILRHKSVHTTEKYIQNINRDLKGVMALLDSPVHKSGTHKQKKVNGESR